MRVILKPIGSTDCCDNQGEWIRVKRGDAEAVSVVVGQPQHGTRLVQERITTKATRGHLNKKRGEIASLCEAGVRKMYLSGCVMVGVHVAEIMHIARAEY